MAVPSAAGVARLPARRGVAAGRRRETPAVPGRADLAGLRSTEARLSGTATRRWGRRPAANPPARPAQVAKTTRDLLSLLERHLATEEALLATAHAPRPARGDRGPDQPLTRVTSAHRGPVIALDGRPPPAGRRGGSAAAAAPRRAGGVALKHGPIRPGGFGFGYMQEARSDGPCR